MMVSIIPDIIAAVVLIAAFAYGKRRGIIKMLWSAFAWLITLLLAAALSGPVSGFVAEMGYAEDMRDNAAAAIETALADKTGFAGELTPEYISELTGIPAALIPDSVNGDALVNEPIHSAAQTIADSLVKAASKAAAGIVLFLLLRVVMTILYHALNIASRLPVITNVNHLLGGILSLICTLLAMYLVLGAAAVFFTDSAFTELIRNTYLVKYFYNNNILLQLIKL